MLRANGEVSHDSHGRSVELPLLQIYTAAHLPVPDTGGGEREREEHVSGRNPLSRPARFRKLLASPEYSTCRYEVGVGIDPVTGENSILFEKVLLTSGEQKKSVQMSMFPRVVNPPDTLSRMTPAKGVKTIINKVPGGNDNFYDETGNIRGITFIASRKSWHSGYMLRNSCTSTP
jgi:hypothetical protein